MTRIFISYRREDSAPYAGRLHDRLVQRFGAEHVFMDIDQIKPGDDFVDAIDRYVKRCDIALVVIGPRWLGARAADGQRRLDHAADFVRMEVEAALQRAVRVIPILVGGAGMPAAELLPVGMSTLARRNAVTVRDTNFHQDVTQLMRALDGADQEHGSAAVSAPAREAPRSAVQSPGSPPATAVVDNDTARAGRPAAAAPATGTSTSTTPWLRMGWATAVTVVVITLGSSFLMSRKDNSAAPDSAPAPAAAPPQVRADAFPVASPTLERVKATPASTPASTPALAPALMPALMPPALVPPAPVLVASSPSPSVDLKAPVAGTSELRRMAWKYRMGDGVVKNPDEAARLFKQAADAGDLTAEAEHAWMVVTNESKGNFKVAIKRLQDLAERGEPGAMAHVGDLHWAGNSLRKDHPKAFALFTKAAQAGHPSGQVMLGNMFRDGQATAKDLAMAARWYAAAAEQGDSFGQYNLAQAFSKALGVPRDEGKAVLLYEKAARQGHSAAQAELQAAGRTW
jgi:hypothetical protein